MERSAKREIRGSGSVGSARHTEYSKCLPKRSHRAPSRSKLSNASAEYLLTNTGDERQRRSAKDAAAAISNH